jgi:hypothetical protein
MVNAADKFETEFQSDTYAPHGEDAIKTNRNSYLRGRHFRRASAVVLVLWLYD